MPRIATPLELEEIRPKLEAALTAAIEKAHALPNPFSDDAYETIVAAGNSVFDDADIARLDDLPEL